MESVGERIRKIRERAGMNKVMFADAICANKSSITRYETDAIKPNMDALQKISEEFNVSIDWIVFGDDKIPDTFKDVIERCKEAGISADKLNKIIDIIDK